MGSSRKSKSTRAKSARPDVLEMRPGILGEIDSQRSALVTVITLLHCLHVVLQQREASIDSQIDRRMEVAARWASLPEMTAMLLERTHAVLSALDSTNFTKAVKGFKP